VLAAVRGTDLQLYVTGDPRRPGLFDVAGGALPNVRFMGFLQEEDYWALLRSADGIVDLTRMTTALCAVAYEALALGKRCSCRTTRASIELFGRALFHQQHAADIRRGIEGLRLGRAQLEAEAERKRIELGERWNSSARDLVVSMGHRTDGFSARANELKLGTGLNCVRDIYSTLDDER